MLYVIAILCLLVGGGLVWYFKVKPLQKGLVLSETRRKAVSDELLKEQTRATDLFQAALGIYSAAFGPYGTPPSVLTDSFNKLWRLIGKEERGAPK